MKKINLLAVLAIVAATLCACSEKKIEDPYQTALIEALQKQSTEQFTSVEFFAFEKIDSSTFRDEFGRRRSVFELKVEHDSTLYAKFVGEKKPTNAEIQRKNMLKDQGIIVRLDSLAESFGDNIDDVAFYDYHFSVLAKGKTSVMKLDDAYAAITPNYEVVGLTTKKRDIHKATGKSIPGYLELIKDEGEE